MNKLTSVLIMSWLFVATTLVNSMQIPQSTTTKQSTSTIIKKSCTIGFVSWLALGSLISYACTIDQPNGPEYCKPATSAINSFFMACMLALADARARISD